MKTDNASNIWEYRIKKAFARKQSTDFDSSSLLWNIITLLLFATAKDTVLIDIYNFFEDKDEFVRFLSVVNGRTLKVPTKDQLEDVILTALFYYEKEVNGKTWKEIQENLEFEISPIKYGIKVKNLNNWIKQKLQEIVRGEDHE